MGITRRRFLKTSITAGGVLVLRPSALLGQSSAHAPVPRRLLGKTREKVSIIALGGIVVSGVTDEHARQVVDESVEKGVNYFDVAPTYGDAEVKLGPALAPYRDKVFLACKTTRRDREGAKEELEKSLQRLQTDHLDLYQLHAIADVEKDVKGALAKGGAMETFLAARKQGKVRFIGFSAHTPEAALAAMKEFDFDTIMYPINFVSHHHSGFEVEVVAEAKKRNMGILAIKTLVKDKSASEASRKAFPGCGYEPVADPALANLAVSWALDQGATTVIPPHVEQIYRLALEVAPGSRALTSDETARLKSLSQDLQPVFPR